ncbi:MAG TPA: FAD-binding protein, partial [Acidimicrobiales bacterium]
MADVIEVMRAAVGNDKVVGGDAVKDDLCHDEALGIEPVTPACAVFPESVSDVVAVLETAGAGHIPVTARGSGTGLSGAAIPHPDGVLVSFERMNTIIEIDVENLVA